MPTAAPSITQITNLSHLYLLSPLHTGGTTQEGNLLGIAREAHTEFPYLPSSTIRGRLRASVFTDQGQDICYRLFGNEITDQRESLTQGSIWVGDGSILWFPIASLSHGVLWVSCPMLLRRWSTYQSEKPPIPNAYATNLNNSNQIYLKDVILQKSDLILWSDWKKFIPKGSETESIERVLVLPDKYFATVVQMGLWRQVKVKLDEHKTVKDGSFRYEEAIPPDAVMYFPWGVTTQRKSEQSTLTEEFQDILNSYSILQIGGQESLGRGFVQQWSVN